MARREKVSVPYRGAIFLNRLMIHIQKSSKKVSVPYRGAIFLNGQVFAYIVLDKIVSVPYRGAIFLNIFQFFFGLMVAGFRPLSGSYISQFDFLTNTHFQFSVSVPYRGAIFLNEKRVYIMGKKGISFRPLSGSYISQYHPRNPMSCLGRIGGLRGKSNFIEIQPFWKVKNSHKSSI